MRAFSFGLRALLLAFSALVAASVAAPAQTSPPAPINPTAQSVKEEALFKALKDGGTISGRITIPDQKASNLIQPEGRDFRVYHQRTLYWIGAIAVLGMVGLLAVFYLARGTIRIEKGRSGKTILRFGGFDRFVHWLTASTFVILGISGLNVAFGKSVLMPLIGPDAFAAFSQLAKYAHNYLSFPFTVGIVLTFLIWVKDNIPNSVDVAWFKAGGGLLGNGHPPAAKFNGGQKIIFWSVVLVGGAIAISGYFLIFPFYWTQIGGMQLAQVIHGVLGVVLIAIILAHIYIGTIGMEGAFDAMGTGKVDLNWAREHHSLWAEKELGHAGGTMRQAAVPAE